MSCTLTHYDLAERRVYSTQVHFGSSAACLSVPLWVPQLGRPCISFASLRVVSRGSPALDEYGAHGFGPWLGDPVVPSHAPAQPLPTQPRTGTVRATGFPCPHWWCSTFCPWHPKRISQQAGSCGLRIKPCGYQCSQSLAQVAWFAAHRMKYIEQKPKELFKML